jgi:hypothetical protein
MLKFLLKLKVGNIESAAKRLVTATGCKCKMRAYGAYDVDPRLLGIVIQVATDAERDKLKSRAGLTQALKALPAQNGWPENACADVSIEIESHETVDRDNDGNWSVRYG